MGGDYFGLAVILALKIGIMSYWFRVQLYPGKWPISIFSLVYVFILFASSVPYRIIFLFIGWITKADFIINFYIEGLLLFGTIIATYFETGFYALFEPSDREEKVSLNSLFKVNGILLGIYLVIIAFFRLLS